MTTHHIALRNIIIGDAIELIVHFGQIDIKQLESTPAPQSQRPRSEHHSN